MGNFKCLAGSISSGRMTSRGCSNFGKTVAWTRTLDRLYVQSSAYMQFLHHAAFRELCVYFVLHKVGQVREDGRESSSAN